MLYNKNRKILNALKIVTYKSDKFYENGIEYKNQYKFSSDFETLIVNEIHYVYAIGLMYFVKNDKKVHIEYKDFFIDLDTSMKDLEVESNILIKNYIFFLLNFFNEKEDIYIYFHNLGSFDGMFLVKTINKYFQNQKKNILIRNNNIYKIVLRNITFLDSYNLFNASLDKIGETFFNLKKLKIDLKNLKSIKDIKKNFFLIKKYLYRDVEILYKFIEKWSLKMLESFNIDITVHFTISSIALAFFRKYYLYASDEIELTKNYKYHFIKKSYFGGLCNVLNTQCDIKGYYYDVNSLYPSQMKTQYYPVGKGIFLYNCSVINLTNYFGFIECLVYIKEKIILPPLPFHIKNVICQPIGLIKGVWWSEELKNAINLGVKIIKIYKVLHYERKKKIFEHFINDVYDKRLKSKNILEKNIYKSIMNSLYGRFGMDIYKNDCLWTENQDQIDILEDISDVKNDEFYENNHLFTYKINPELYESVLKTEISIERRSKMIKEYNHQLFKNEDCISCIQLASAISAYSRMKLVNDITNHIKNKNAIVYYYDTDSIITNIKLNDEWIDEKEIGKYKLEYEFNKGIFIAPKIYFIKKNVNIIKFKGLKKYETQKYTYEMFKKFLEKNYSHILNNNIKYFNKDYNNLNIKTIEFKEIKIHFESFKYVKIYDKNNIFVKTKPIKYNIIYISLFTKLKMWISFIKKWFYKYLF